MPGRRGDVFVADRENSRVQVFTAAGAHKATWLSRASTAMNRAVYSRHVSSITYHPSLDLFAVTEGDSVVLRTPSGCDVWDAAGLRWPHDAVLVPEVVANGGLAVNRSGLAVDGAQIAVYVAELDGKRISKLVTRGAGNGGGRGDNPYGRA